jgi:hypothetical protein
MLVSEKAAVDYLISRYLLKQLLAKGLITHEEFERIDAENKKSFARQPTIACHTAQAELSCPIIG